MIIVINSERNNVERVSFIEWSGVESSWDIIAEKKVKPQFMKQPLIHVRLPHFPANDCQVQSSKEFRCLEFMSGPKCGTVVLWFRTPFLSRSHIPHEKHLFHSTPPSDGSPVCVFGVCIDTVPDVWENNRATCVSVVEAFRCDAMRWLTVCWEWNQFGSMLGIHE